MISVATDGAILLHLHQAVLCAQTFPPVCMEAINIVIQIVNKIIAKALNHRQFPELLHEVDSEIF